MTEITISEGVKIVLEKDCDKCDFLENQCRRLQTDNSQLTAVYKHLSQWELKSVNNTWDAGYNQCLKDVQKFLERFK